MIFDTLNKKIIEAMKAKDVVRVSTLKMLSSEIHNYQIDHPQMTEEEEITVVKKEAKKRKDAIEAYEKGGRKDLADKEKEELKILESYLPPEMEEEELRKIVLDAISKIGAVGKEDFGKVMGLAMEKVQGRADGSRVSAILREKLT